MMFKGGKHDKAISSVEALIDSVDDKSIHIAVVVRTW